MKRTADCLFGATAAGRSWRPAGGQMPIAAMAAAMGRNVRVELEDSLSDGPGEDPFR